MASHSSGLKEEDIIANDPLHLMTISPRLAISIDKNIAAERENRWLDRKSCYNEIKGR